MITYEPLWKTLKAKGLSTYWLVEHGVSKGTIDRLKHGEPITTTTLNDLCNLISCQIEDVLSYTRDDPEEFRFPVNSK